MALSQLDLIRRQLESTARNQINREVAGVRRQLSLVGALRRLSRRTVDTLDAGMRTAGGSPPPRPLDDAPHADATASVQVCADGYLRRSPVQPLYTPPDYRRRQLRRALGAACAVLLALVVLWALVRYSIISI